jgi:hypothetical protein
VKYFLDDISPVLTSIAHTFAVFGVNAGCNYAEEVRAIESKLREIYPDGLPQEHMFGAALAINALVVAFAATESRQQELDHRAERHAEAARTAQAIEDAASSDRLLERYLADSKKLNN